MYTHARNPTALHAVLYRIPKTQNAHTIHLMLFIDMICVQWRHAGKHGRIIVRGTDQLFLFESTLVPTISTNINGFRANVLTSSVDTAAPLHLCDSGVCYYYHTQQCLMPHESQQQCSEKKQVELATRTPVYAMSMGIDVKQHPCVTILYREKFSEHESCIGTVDITYNTLLFKKGFFVDSIMKAQGYGIVLLCHSSNDDPTRMPIRRRLVNWRQCLCIVRQYVQALACKTAPATTTAEVMQGQNSKSTLELHKNGDTLKNHTSSELPDDRQWDISLYQSLKQTMSSTFNILM